MLPRVVRGQEQGTSRSQDPRYLRRVRWVMTQAKMKAVKKERERMKA